MKLNKTIVRNAIVISHSGICGGIKCKNCPLSPNRESKYYCAWGGDNDHSRGIRANEWLKDHKLS